MVLCMFLSNCSYTVPRLLMPMVRVGKPTFPPRHMDIWYPYTFLEGPEEHILPVCISFGDWRISGNYAVAYFNARASVKLGCVGLWAVWHLKLSQARNLAMPFTRIFFAGRSLWISASLIAVSSIMCCSIEPPIGFKRMNPHEFLYSEDVI